MEKELEIVKAYLIEKYIIDRDNCIIESYYDSPYLNDNVYRVYDKNNNIFYADIDNYKLYTETEFFYDYILKEENWLLHCYDEFIEFEEFEEFEKTNL